MRSRLISGRAIRAVVAEQNFEQRCSVENSLIALGCFRTATVSDFDELVSITHYSPDLFERFDLLIANARIFRDVKVQWAQFCLSSSRLKHVLIYDEYKSSNELEVLSERSAYYVWRVKKADSTVLENLIPLIDTANS
ncbi:hypothetical protein ACIOUG_01175 [Pseudomonas sp. NPDC087803]|uniref:hypothetical protein n=1 Tax=Pseudomonas sp. NPDC087803 TaxID=3364448 RepID=UPI003817A244